MEENKIGSLYGRLDILEKDLSGSVRISTSTTGATVLKASKGPEQPIFLGTGQKSKIIQLFGYPSATNPGIAEAIFFNNYRPIWLSAPSTNGLYGGVFVTKTGTIPFTNGIDTKTIADFSAIEVTESLGTGDDLTTSFTLTLDKKAFYVNQSIDIQVAGTTINISASDVDTEVLTTTPDVGSGTYVRATGVLTFVFDTAPTIGQAITTSYTMDLSNDCYFVLTDKDYQVSDRFVKISMNTAKVFTIEAYTNDKGRVLALDSSPYNISLDPAYINPSGVNLYIDNIMADDVYFSYIINTNLAVSTFTKDIANVALKGGSRGDVIDITDYTRGWDYFKNKNTYKTDIFFDTTADAGIVPIFASLRDNNQKWSHYILPLPKEDSLAEAIVTKASYSTSNRGISFYWNWAEIQDGDSGTVFWTSLIGRVATKHALMDNYFNGLAPAWIDENNHGGLLGGGIRKLRWDIQDDTEAIAIEEGRVNAIVNDPVYGVMIIHQRTSVLEETDYSYIGHSRLADYYISNIEKQVVPYQIVKLNDAEHRAIVKSKTDSIISVTFGKPYNLLENFLVVCDESNNTAEVMNRREFKLDVYIIFTKFSEKIRLVFTNAPSGSNLEELIG